MLRRLALVWTLWCCGCGSGLFACADDDDCQGGGATGTCAAAGACAFPDDTCESGQRYGDHAGGLSNHCVPQDATTSAAATTDASASSPTSLEVTSTPDDGAATTDPPADTTSTPLGTSTTAVDPTMPGETASDDNTTGSTVEDPDLLVWLRFTELAEDVSTPNDGVLGGNALCSADCPVIEGGLAQFDGTGDCLSFPSQDELVHQPFTAAAWVMSNDPDHSMFVFGKAVLDTFENSWEVYIVLDDVAGQVLGFEMHAPPDVEIIVDAPVAGQWTHIAAAWDGMTMTLFVDGEIAGEIDNAASLFDDHPVRFGCDEDSGVEVFFFEGWLTDVRVYGRALTPMEVGTLAATVPADPP